jgi:hypothetical protein
LAKNPALVLTCPPEIGKPVGPPPENPLPGVSAEKENKEDKADSDWSEELADNWDFLKDLENDPDFDAVGLLQRSFYDRFQY